jgi:gliding motility-associated-like protein
MKYPYFIILLIFLFVENLNANTLYNFDKESNQSTASFIENKGQFDEFQSTSTGVIHFAVDFGSTKIFFGEKGLSYNFLSSEKQSKEERAKILTSESKNFEEHKSKERLVGKFLFKTDVVGMQWLNINPVVSIVGSGEKEDYHSYYFKDSKGVYQNKNFIKGHEKITYKDVYPNIDLVYTIHPISGVKYAFILYPGANPSNIQMLFDEKINIENGDVLIPTKFGDIIDHAPISFYEGNRSKIIPSFFSLNGQLLSFKMEDYDKSKTVIIDPWTQTPVFNLNWDNIWECDIDGAGNVYVIGGTMPMQLLKYNAAGALQWTYNTPYDTSNSWLGTLATDLAGNSYVTAGSVAKVQKINTSAGVVWNNNSPGGILSSAEFWNISFNCDQSSLVIGGTGGPLLGLDARIFNVDVNMGNITNQLKVAVGSMIGIPPALEEVRGLCANFNGKYYFFTHDTIGYIYDDFTFCQTANLGLKKNDHGMELGYKCENFRQDNTGIKAIKSDQNFLFVNRGNQIQKRSLVDFSIIATATIPGGGFNSVFLSGNAVTNSGIDIDQCGNVYVGSSNQVVKYNSNLVQLATYPVGYNVYDVKVSINGDIIACGGTGTSSSAIRSGGVSSINANACAPLFITCCEPNICNPGVLCLTDPAVQLQVATPGGVFSGPGVNASGVFNPAIAGTGFHTIIYTLPCGSDSISIAVSSCIPLAVCAGQNGVLTVSGVTGPFTWEFYQAANTTPITNQSQCQACGYTWIFGSCLNGVFPVSNCSVPAQWVTYNTGVTSAPPSTYPLRVRDAMGNQVIYNSAVAIPLCAPITCPTIILTVDSFINVSCNGLSNGMATVSSSGGNGVMSYSWMPGNLTGTTQNSLAPNTYTIIATDTSGCADTTTILITQPSLLSINSIGSVNESCQNQNDGSISAAASGGTGTLNYTWSSGTLNGANQANLAPGSYILVVTDINGCTATDTANVLSGPNCCTMTLSAILTNSTCGNSDGAIDIIVSNNFGVPTFQWSTTATTEDLSNVSAGTYNLVCEDTAALSSCVIDTSFTVLDIGSPVVDSLVILNPSCDSLCDGSASVYVSGGVVPYTYQWYDGSNNSIGGNNSFLASLCAGSFYVVITDSNGGAPCPVTFPVILTSPSLEDPSFSFNDFCIGTANSATAIANPGGSFSFNPIPSGGATINSSTGEISNEVIGASYGVQYTTGGSCPKDSIILVNVGGISLDFMSSSNETCQGLNDGSVLAAASGNSGTITYNWIPGNLAGPVQNNLSPGTYIVTVSDAGSCSVMDSVVVNVGPACCNLSFTNVSMTDENCDDNSGSASVTVNSLATNLSYSWSNSATGAAIGNLSEGTYTVTVTDSNFLNCSIDTSITISNTVAPSLDNLIIVDESCSGLGDGVAEVLVSGGTPPYTFTWSSSINTTSTESGLLPGTYDLTVSDINCSVSQNFTINSGVLISIDAGNDTLLATEDSIVLAPTVLGSLSGSFNWQPAIDLSCVACQNPIANPTEDLIYTVFYIDSLSGCIASDDMAISFLGLDPFCAFPTAFSPNLDAVNDYFRSICEEAIKIDFKVYNRWGEVVYMEISNDNFLTGWDGFYKSKPAPVDVYVYAAEVTYSNGTMEMYSGNVSILR